MITLVLVLVLGHKLKTALFGDYMYVRLRDFPVKMLLILQRNSVLGTVFPGLFLITKWIIATKEKSL